MDLLLKSLLHGSFLTLPGTAAGSWEAIAVPDFEPLVQDDDAFEVVDVSKGKGKAPA